MPSRSPASRGGKLHSTGRNRKIPAWPNHANRNLSSQATANDSRRGCGTTCARSCHHLGSLASPNKFLANSTFSAGKVGQSDRLSEPNASDAPTTVAVLSIHLDTNISLALRRTTSPWPVFQLGWHFGDPTDPISSRRVRLTHPRPNDFSGRSDRLRATVWTVATHGIASGLISLETAFSLNNTIAAIYKSKSRTSMRQHDRAGRASSRSKGKSAVAIPNTHRGRQQADDLPGENRPDGPRIFNVSRQAPSPQTSTACGRSRIRRGMSEKIGSTSR
jgi:hypothetical protein